MFKILAWWWWWSVGGGGTGEAEVLALLGCLGTEVEPASPGCLGWIWGWRWECSSWSFLQARYLVSGDGPLPARSQSSGGRLEAGCGGLPRDTFSLGFSSRGDLKIAWLMWREIQSTAFYGKWCRPVWGLSGEATKKLLRRCDPSKGRLNWGKGGEWEPRLSPAQRWCVFLPQKLSEGISFKK